MSFIRCRLIFASLLLCLCVCTSANAIQSDSLQAVVELRDGTNFEGELQNIDRDTAAFIVNGNVKAISVENINRIQYFDQPNEPSAIANSIVLVDGSELFCVAFTIVDRELIAKTETDAEFRIKSRLVDSIHFPSVDPEFKKNWKKIVKEERESDALVVSRDEKLQMIDGIFGDVAAESVSFTVGERTADVKRSRLAGMLFYRRVADELAPSVFVLELKDGSVIEVQSLSIETEKCEVRTVAGADIEVDPATISKLDFSSKREVWLTDLEPATNDWTPLMAGSSVLGSLKKFSMAKIDRGFSGKPLAVMNRGDDGSWERKEFAKGFAIKGGGKLSFLMGRQYQRLTGAIGFDPDANSTGVAKLIIQVDGVNQVEQVLDASEMKKAFPIDIDLNGSDRIVFQIEYHDRRSVGDILHAVDMKLVR